MWTIGYGVTQGVQEGMTITKEQAEDLLQKEVRKFFNAVIARVGTICNANQIGALTSLCYNIGIGAFGKSSLLKVIQKDVNNFQDIEVQFLKWNKVNKKELKGLTNRRQKEFKVYCQL